MNSKIFPLLKQLLSIITDSLDTSTKTQIKLKTKICTLLDSPRLKEENCTKTSHVVFGIADIFREIRPLNTALLTLLSNENSKAKIKATKILITLANEIEQENLDNFQNALTEIDEMRNIWTNTNKSEYFYLGLSNFLDSQNNINTSKLRATIEIMSSDDYTYDSIKQFNHNQAKIQLMSLESQDNITDERIL